MKRQSVDILISGGGIAGLIATCAFAQKGFSVLCVDPSIPVTQAKDAGSDLRSTAFLQPAKETLAQAGLWEKLEPFSTKLNVMRLADAGGAENEIRYLADFDSAEISDDPFAWNLPNWLLRRELVNQIEIQENATLLTGVKTGRITPRTNSCIVQIEDRLLECKLLIGADGRNSHVRQSLGIDTKVWRYSQKALAFVIAHELPHQNVSTEIHRTGGPFTLVPLPDTDGIHHSSVVWMETASKATTLANLPEDAFNAALNERSCGVLGHCKLASRRDLWPIITQKSQRMIAERTALIAEAAHVIPPIGAQGLNMSLRDIDCLLNLVHEIPDNLGSAKHLEAYEKERMSQIAFRMRGVDALNRAAMAQSANLRDLRLKGLEALHGLTPVRRGLMKKGIGHS